MNTKLPPAPDCACGCRRKAVLMGYAKECLDKKAATGYFDDALQRVAERNTKVKKVR